MNSENNSLNQPEKSKFKKLWKSQSAGTGDSRKKLESGVEQLTAHGEIGKTISP